MLSSSPTSSHYSQRSSERSEGGGMVPFHRKKVGRMIKDGRAKIIEKDSSGRRVRLPTGETILVNRKTGKVISYFGY